MMKMRSKRDQRPLLTQEAPILSDQMDPPSDALDDEDDFHQQQQQSKANKKRSWRRLFGKGGSNNNSKRKDNQNSQGTVDGSLPSFSQSSSSDSGDSATQKPETQQDKNTTHSHRSQRRTISPQSDKRDDVIDNHSSHIKVTTTATTPSEYSYAQKNTHPSSRSTLNLSHLSSPATTATSIAAKSAVTQQHRNHISPRQMAASAAPLTTRSANSRSASGRRTVNSQASLEKMRKMNRAASASGVAATAATNKILSRPFGREHILTTEQAVCFD